MSAKTAKSCVLVGCHVEGFNFEAAPQVKGVALKLKHTPGPNASYGNKVLESHFLMPPALARHMRDQLNQVLAGDPSRRLNS